MRVRNIGGPALSALLLACATSSAESRGSANDLVAADGASHMLGIIWSAPPNAAVGTPSTDRRFLPYAAVGEDGARQLYIRDQRTRVSHSLHQLVPGFPGEVDRSCGCAMSPDGTMLVYSWWADDGPGGQDRPVLNLLRWQGPGPATHERLFAPEGATGLWAIGWDRRGRSITVHIERGFGATVEVGVLPLAGGPLRIIKGSALGRAPGRPSISPDGRVVAFEMRQEDGDGRDIHLHSLENGRDTTILQWRTDEQVVGWALEGEGLLFLSDRRGATDLWLLPFSDGRPSDPILVHLDVGRINALGVSVDGAIVHTRVPAPNSRLRTAAFNFSTGELASDATDVVGEYVGRNANPIFSHDGTQLAFISDRVGVGGRRTLVMQSHETGLEREITLHMPSYSRRLAPPRWSPDDRDILLHAADRNGNPAVYRLRVANGELSVMEGVPELRTTCADARRVFFDRPATAGNGSISLIERDLLTGADRVAYTGPAGGAARLALSRDCETLFYRWPVPVADAPHALIARDLRSGRERTLIEGRALGPLALSPAGTYVVTRGAGATLLIPTNEGEQRSLPAYRILAWSPDDSAFLGVREDVGLGDGPLHWVRTSDGLTRAVSLAPASAQLSDVVVHPNGRRVAFVQTDAAVPRPIDVLVLTVTLPRNVGLRD